MWSVWEKKDHVDKELGRFEKRQSGALDCRRWKNNRKTGEAEKEPKKKTPPKTSPKEGEWEGATNPTSIEASGVKSKKGERGRRHPKFSKTRGNFGCGGGRRILKKHQVY